MTHGGLPRYSAVLPLRRRAREYDEYRTVLRGSGTRGGLRGSDPKKGIFEYDEYRAVLRRTRPRPSTDEYVGYTQAEIGLKVLDGTRLSEYDEYRTVLPTGFKPSTVVL